MAPAILVVVAASAAFGAVGGVLAGVVAIAWAVVISVVLSAMSGIYRTALYRYAATGEVPGDFSGIDFQAQFRPRRFGRGARS
jgi:hypothetical protein